MIVLGIDTSTRVASIGIVRDGVHVASRTAQQHNRSDNLLANIDEMLSESGIRPGELNAVAIGLGPGSFTGLRIGMATAKGLALGLGVPLWTTSSLEAIAWQCRPTDGAKTVLVLADASRREVFAGAFRVTPNTVTALCEETVLSPPDVAAMTETLGDDLCIVGQGIDVYPDTLGPLGSRFDQVSQTPTGTAVAERAIAGESGDTLTTATPVYIRPSEAEVNFPNGNPGGTFASKA